MTRSLYRLVPDEPRFHCGNLSATELDFTGKTKDKLWPEEILSAIAQPKQKEPFFSGTTDITV